MGLRGSTKIAERRAEARAAEAAALLRLRLRARAKDAAGLLRLRRAERAARLLRRRPEESATGLRWLPCEPTGALWYLGRLRHRTI